MKTYMYINCRSVALRENLRVDTRRATDSSVQTLALVIWLGCIKEVQGASLNYDNYSKMFENIFGIK